MKKRRVIVLGALSLVGAPRILRKYLVCDGMSVSIFLLLNSRATGVVRAVLYHRE